jgi:hypothetical protein
MKTLPPQVPAFLTPPTDPPLCSVLFAMISAFAEGPLCPTIKAIYTYAKDFIFLKLLKLQSIMLF